MKTMPIRYSFLIRVVAATLILAMAIAGPVAGEQKKKDRFFNITMLCPIGMAPREKAAQIMARDFEKIGIGVNLRFMESAAIGPRLKLGAKKGATFDEGGYDLSLTRSNLDAFPDASGIYIRFASDQIYPSGSNRVRYRNPEFDKLIYKALGTVNDKERWKLSSQAIGILYNDLPSIPLFIPTMYYAMRNEIKFPKDKNTFGYKTYAFRWAKREIPGKTKDQMTLRERTLVYYQVTDIEGFLVGYTNLGSSTRAVGFTAFDALMEPVDAAYAVGPEEERGPKPALAESWTVSEDGKTWHINLRKNVLWHDGEKFTADDVIFTFNLINNKEAGYGSNKFFKKNGITWEKIDEYTVKFVCKKYTPLFASQMLAHEILPNHLLSKIPPKDLAKSEFHTRTAVGTGPFVLDEYRPAEYIKFKANDKYYGGRPWFDYLVIKFVPKASSAWLALKTGEVDCVDSTYALTHELEEIKKSPDLRAEMEAAIKTQIIRVNNDHPHLKNVYVRRALSLACNRRVMVDVISYGLGEVANQHIPHWNPGAAKNVEPLKYDLNEAKRMLIKAGYDYDTIIVDGPKDDIVKK